MKKTALPKVLSQAPPHQEPDNTLITTPSSQESQKPLSLEPSQTDTLEPPLIFQPMELTHMDKESQKKMLLLEPKHTPNTHLLLLMELTRLLIKAQLHMDHKHPPSTAKSQPLQEDSQPTLILK